MHKCNAIYSGNLFQRNIYVTDLKFITKIMYVTFSDAAFVLQLELLLTIELLCFQLCLGALLSTARAILIQVGAFCLRRECVSEPLIRNVSKEAQL